MKRILRASVAVLLLAGAAGAQFKTDREKSLLLGPVRSVRDEMAKIVVKDGVAVEGPRMTTHLFVFDAEGNHAEASHYTDGKLAIRVKYIYENSRWVGSENYAPAGRLISRTVRSYDAAGRVQAATTYDSAGNVTGRAAFVYAPDGTPSEVSSYDAKGNLWSRRTTTTGDERARKTEEIHYQPPGGGVAYRSVWSVSADGSAFDSAEYDGDGLLQSSEKFANGLPYSTIYNADGTVRRNHYYTLDESDAHGNWTKRTLWAVESGKAEAVSAYYRVIAYH